MSGFQKLRLKVVVLLALLAPVLSTAGVFAQAVTTGYTADSSIQKGMIVKIKDSNPNAIEALTTNTLAHMQGVVVAANDAPVTLSNGTGSQQTYVATTGRYDVLVSNQNGAINVGDYITISSLAGVGMKADASQAIVLGKALAKFDGKNNVDGTATVGGQNIAIGRIQTEIAISHNPLAVVSDKSVTGWLQKVGQSVASKTVSPIRLYGALVVFFICVITAGSMLYSGIRTSLTAIGRNPLARSSILKNLLLVIFASLIIVVIGIVAVYLILKL